MCSCYPGFGARINRARSSFARNMKGGILFSILSILVHTSVLEEIVHFPTYVTD